MPRISHRTAAITLMGAALFASFPLAAQDAPVGSGALTLTVLGTYETGVFAEGASEIVAYHAASQNLYIVNGDANAIDIVNIADPAAPELISQIAIEEYAEGLTHVAIYEDLVAVALENGQANGLVAFFTPEGEAIAQYEVGALPDMLRFTPDGTQVLTANEGEPSGDYADDPEGSVSIVDISAGADAAEVTTITFGDATAELDPAIRVYGPNATAAQDFEPEYIAVSPDGSTAYVTLQESNAIAVIDIATASVTEIYSLGFKDHTLEGNGIDASNEDGAINITNYPVFGIYSPDAIATYSVGDDFYLVTANEGDTRDYEDSFSEEVEVSELTLDAEAFPDAEDLQLEENLGKLEVTSTLGDADGDGDYEELYVPGGRSFSILTPDGELIFDSGDDFEQITAAAYPDDFNTTNEENGAFDDRSDNKGPEPEGVVVGIIDEDAYAFIGLERIGGVMVYDITDPAAPEFVTYANNRDFSGDAEAGTAGDLGPEGLLFIAAEESPTGGNLLVVANEISGSTTVYAIEAGE